MRNQIRTRPGQEYNQDQIRQDVSTLLRTGRFLDVRDTRRVEMIVDPNHRAACRWARLLGFEQEGYMKLFSPDGRDALMFARVRDERR